VAAHAFRCAQGRDFEDVAVLCPSHYVDYAPVLTSAHSAYRTPLGDVPVDHETLALVRAAVPMMLVARDPEHALEIELPFLQRALGAGFKLVPIMLREQSRALAEALGQALAEALRGRRALLVASSDLAHFQPQAATEALDGYMLGRIAALDPAGVLEAEAAGRGVACGKGAIAAVLWAALALGATGAQTVLHATSGDVTGDYGAVVGYGAAAIWK
jgi:AmmeMemoRadiSam system protein B